MENTIQTEELNKDEKLLRDTQNDEYWAKKYDISVDELKKTNNTGILDVIIEAGIKRKSFVL